MDSRSNMTVNVKAVFLEDCFISLANVLQLACQWQGDKEIASGWLWLCVGSDTVLKGSNEGKG